jgi:hypothetical protein
MFNEENYLPTSIGSFSIFDWLFLMLSSKQRNLRPQATNPSS